MKRSILRVLAVLLVTGGCGVANAQARGNVYSNKFVGLSFSVPEGWYIATDNEAKDLMSDGARVVGLDDPSATSVVAQMPDMVLLAVSERPFSVDPGVNTMILFLAINVRDMKNEISSGADYLGPLARDIRESEPRDTVSNIVTQPLGGEEFHRLNVTLRRQDITAYVSQLARIHNDYIVILSISAGSGNRLTELVQIADKNMRLSAVSQVVDSSPEGASFRKKFSLNISDSSGVVDSSPEAVSFRKKSSLNISGSSGRGSSGGNLLKNLGIILMILGAFLLILVAFRFIKGKY